MGLPWPESARYEDFMMSARAVIQHHPMQTMEKPVSGKGAARLMRRQGFTPAVVYGPGQAPMTLGVATMDLAKALRVGHFFTHLQELVIGGKPMKVLAKDIQRHPVTDMPIHVDFTYYEPARKVNVDVMVRIIGEKESPGIKLGGVLQLIETSLEVVCRADSIPQEIEVSVAGLDIGGSVHLSSLTLPEGVRSAVTNRDLTIASVVSTRTSNMAADATAAAAVSAADVPASTAKAPAAAAAPAGKDAKGAKAPAKDAKAPTAKAPAAAAKPAAKKK
jgi:large subunit ribosomal protein L25